MPMLSFNSMVRCASWRPGAEAGLDRLDMSQEAMRDMFNSGGFLRAAVAGHPTCCYLGKAPANLDGEPIPVTTITFDCFDSDGRRRFRAHCYVREDERGNLSYAGSGRRLSDPKVLIVEGTTYVIATKDSLASRDAQAELKARQAGP